MKRIAAIAIAAVVAVIFAVMILPGGQNPALAQYGDVPTNVSAAICLSTGGTVTVTPGAHVFIASSWYDKSQGVVTNFVKHQFTIVSVEGRGMLDVSDTYSAPEFNTGLGLWGVVARYDTGIVLQPYTSMQFTFTLVLSGPVPGLPDATSNNLVHHGPGLSYGGTCRVRAVP